MGAPPPPRAGPPNSVGGTHSGCRLLPERRLARWGLRLYGESPVTRDRLVRCRVCCGAQLFGTKSCVFRASCRALSFGTLLVVFLSAIFFWTVSVRRLSSLWLFVQMPSCVYKGPCASARDNVFKKQLLDCSLKNKACGVKREKQCIRNYGLGKKSKKMGCDDRCHESRLIVNSSMSRWTR